MSSVAPSRPSRRRTAGRAILVGIAVIAIAAQAATLSAVGWAAANPRAVADQWTVARYSPGAAISTLAERAGMSERGRFVFFASRPAVVEGDRFGELCTADEPGIGVLGCFTRPEGRIYLFPIASPELEGLQAVVAAHEMLHAAWDRMDAAEQAALAEPLNAAFADLGPDHELVERIALYEESDPDSRIPELYAILGSEVAELPEVLEAHYAGWFDDRAAVTTLYETSTSVFRELDARLTALQDEIAALGATIDADRAAFTAQSEQLAADIDDFNVRADTEGAFDSVEEFDAERATILERQEALETARIALNDTIDSYNALLVELDALNLEATALNRAINVVPKPLPSE